MVVLFADQNQSGMPLGGGVNDLFFHASTMMQIVTCG